MNNKNKILVIFITSLFVNNFIITNISCTEINKNENHKDIIFDLKIRLLKKLTSSPSLSVCVIKNDSIVWSKGYGFSKIYTLKTPDKDTIYPVASVTKSVTTTAFLQLYEKGLFDLDDDINKHLPFNITNPNFPDDPITIRMLLSHRASIFDYCVFTPIGMISTLLTQSIPDNLGLFIKENLIPGEKHYNSRYWFKYPPGEKVKYSNMGFLIICYLFEIIANQTIEDYCQENLFEPLEMYNTSYHPQNLNKNQMASIYIRKARILIPIPNYDAKAFAAMGGLRTTIEDLSHFLIAHMNNGTYKDIRILKNETIAVMHDCIYEDPNINPLHHNFGLGWWKEHKFNREIMGHGGMCPGATCFMMMNETENIGFIFMTNQFNIFSFFTLIRFRIAAEIRYVIGELLLQKAEDL